MAGSSTRDYNADILAVACPSCGAKPKQRCQGATGSIHLKPPHKARKEAAANAKRDNK
jgi:hypothetical protein